MSSTATLKRRPESPGIASRFSPFPSMAEQVQSGPQQSRACRFLGAGKRTLDGEDRSERIKTGRKGTPFRAFSPTIKPEFPNNKAAPESAAPRSFLLVALSRRFATWTVALLGG